MTAGCRDDRIDRVIHLAENTADANNFIKTYILQSNNATVNCDERACMIVLLVCRLVKQFSVENIGYGAHSWILLICEFYDVLQCRYIVCSSVMYSL